MGKAETLRRKVLSKLRADIVLDAVIQPKTAKGDRLAHFPLVGVSAIVARVPGLAVGPWDSGWVITRWVR